MPINEANVTTSSCFGNISSDVAAIMNQTMKHELNHIYKFWQGLVPLPLAVCGLMLSLIYIAAIYRSIRQRRVSRKCYVLLINRAVGDTLACIAAIVMGTYAISAPIVGREMMQMLDIFFFCSFWSAMVSYVALSLIKLYAVWQPLNYRKRVNMERCIYLIVFSWLLFGVMVGYALTTIALVRIPFLNAWSGCRVETCIRYMYRIRNFTVATVYTITLICFAITVVLLRRAQKFMRSFHQKSSNTTNSTNTKRRSLKDRFPLWKLSLNVSTFAFFNGFYVIWAVALLIRADRCFFLLHFNQMMLLLALVRLSLLSRIMMDPILAFVTDVHIRRSTLLMLGLDQRKIKPTDSKKRMFWFGRSEPSEENSSDADLKNLNRQSSRVNSSSTDRPTFSTDLSNSNSK